LYVKAGSTYSEQWALKVYETASRIEFLSAGHEGTSKNQECPNVSSVPLMCVFPTLNSEN
jgi:hypothetical protein